MEKNNPGNDTLQVSVIIPVYNVAPWLKTCLDSVTAQTFRNLEIWLVDDGSTDGSGAICEEYAARDGRIRVIHQKNAGLSAARNAALDRMTGRYVMFVDSDDVVAPDIVEVLLQGIQESSAGMCCCNYSTIDENGVVLFRKERYRPLTVEGKENCMRAYLQGVGIDTMAWAKLYDASLFNGLRYPVGRSYEDIATAYLLVDRCSRISVVDEYKYYYRKRPASITTRAFDSRRLDGVTAAEERFLFIRDKYPMLYPMAAASLGEKCIDRFIHMPKESDCRREDVQALQSFCRRALPRSFRYLTLKKKLYLVGCAFSTELSLNLLRRMKKAFLPRLLNQTRKLHSLPAALTKIRQDKALEATFGRNDEFTTWDGTIRPQGRIAVYTCLYGGYDTLSEPATVPEGVDFIAFTDAEVPAGSVWKKRELPAEVLAQGLSAQRLSRYAKLLPHRVLPEYEYSVYVDANIQLRGDPTQYIGAVGPVPIAFSWHRTRNCVYKEAEACIIRQKDDPELIRRQMQAYREAGMPEGFGLTENNFIIRRHNDESCIRLMEQWWTEFMRFSCRDQLCLTFAMWQCGFTLRDFGFFNVKSFYNPMFNIRKHTEKKS